jgi:hypothetical protein
VTEHRIRGQEKLHEATCTRESVELLVGAHEAQGQLGSVKRSCERRVESDGRRKTAALRDAAAGTMSKTFQANVERTAEERRLQWE